MTSRLVAGIDSSTQSVKIVVRDLTSGELIREGRASHPDGTQVAPSHWLEALDVASKGILEGVEAISIGAQQHGAVVMDERREVVRDVLLWNDTRSAQSATDLVNELGGGQQWADAVGSVPVAAFTIAKLRWIATHEPENAARISSVCLPHDYLTWNILGKPAEIVTDRGDASGTGYFSPRDNKYRLDLLSRAFGRELSLPRIASPHEIIGHTPSGIAVAPGTGDNMAASLGLGAKPGDIVISLGTSGTAYAVSKTSTHDGSGIVAGFADATGNFLPLACTLNAARVINAGAQLLNLSLDDFATVALTAKPGSGGLVLLPFLDGERTPNLPDARGSLHNLTRTNMTSANFARACFEGMLATLASAAKVLINLDPSVKPSRILLIGGAAASEAVQEISSTLFDVPIHIPPESEYVADGAARQAAWALSGLEQAPEWISKNIVIKESKYAPEILENYSNVLASIYTS